MPLPLSLLALVLLQDPFGGAPVGAVGDSVQVATFPARPFVRPGRTARYLNFDFHITNRSSRKVTLARVVLSVLDPQGAVIDRRFVAARTAVVDGIQSIPTRDIAPDSSIGVFNPFHTFDPAVPLRRLRYEFGFDIDGLPGQFQAVVAVEPEERAVATPLRPPLQARALVYDADDFYSHHRRIDATRLGLVRAGWADVYVRHAIDWVGVNERGDLWSGDRTRPESWVGYGATVVAPGGGRVISVENGVPDNMIRDGKLVLPPGLSGPAASLGNHVIIDHGNGETSQLAHLRAGSVRVAAGSRVEAGQPIAEVGFSGDTGYHVHVHHHVVTGPPDRLAALRAVPLVFERFRVWRGGGWERVVRGAVETGEIVMADP